MTRSARMVWALALAAVAIVLLGFAAFSMQSRIDALEGQLVQAESDLDAVRSAQEAERFAFFNTVLSPEFEAELDRLVAEPSMEERQRLTSQIDVPLLGLPVEYGAAIEVFVRLEFLAEAPTQAQREEIRQDFVQKIFDMMPEADPERFVTKDQASAISLLVTAFGGLVSGISSLFLFVTGGGKRDIEEQMLEVDLEMKRVQLAQLRYDAKDALSADVKT